MFHFTVFRQFSTTNKKKTNAIDQFDNFKTVMANYKEVCKKILDRITNNSTFYEIIYTQLMVFVETLMLNVY